MDLDVLKMSLTLTLLGILAIEDLKFREMHDLPLFAYSFSNPTLTLIQIIKYKPDFLQSLGLAVSSIIVTTFAILYCVGAVADGDLLMSIGLYFGHPWSPVGNTILPFPLLLMSLSLLSLLVHAAATKGMMLGKCMSKEEALSLWRDRYIVILSDGKKGGKELLLQASGKVRLLDPPPFVFHSYLGFIFSLVVNLITQLAS